MARKARRTVRFIPCSEMPRDPTAHEEVECFLMSNLDIPGNDGEEIARYLRWLQWAKNRKDSILPRY